MRQHVQKRLIGGLVAVLSLVSCTEAYSQEEVNAKSLKLRQGEHIDIVKLRQLLTMFPEIQTIDANWTNFSDNEIELLIGNHKIRELDLGITKVSQRCNRTISTLKSLEKLVLSGNNASWSLSLPSRVAWLDISCTNTKDLSWLAKAANLRTLLLSFSRIDDESLRKLPPSLEELDLAHTSFSNAGALTKLERLKVLRAGNTKLTDAGAVELHRLRMLSELDLEHTAISHRSAEVIKRLAGLTKLNVSYTGIRDEGVKAVCENTSLVSLTVGGITDKAIPGILKLKSLQYLGIYESGVTGPGIASLAKCAKLKSLTLLPATIAIDDDLVDGVSRISDLETLDLRSSWQAKNLGVLSRNKRLKSLGINLSGSPDETLKDLTVLTSLRDLYVFGHVDANTMKNIAKARRLSKLHLTACCVTDEVAKDLASMDSLEELDLSFNGRLTDDSIPTLEKLQKLKVLSILCNGMTEDGHRELLRKLPRCRIAFVPFSALGIESDDAR